MIVEEPHAPEVPPPLPVPHDRYRLQTSRLAGIEYHDIDRFADRIDLGTPLDLIAEPANPHDKYAVRVQFEETLIGYLPRKSNHVVSRLLRQGCPLTAQVAYLSKPGPPRHFSDPPYQITDLTLHILLKK